MIYDFHTQTTLSDGDLSPIEQIRRAVVNGYAAIALTDHAGLADSEHVLKSLLAACETARRYWNIIAIPGLELTHLPPAAIPESRGTRPRHAELPRIERQRACLDGRQSACPEPCRRVAAGYRFRPRFGPDRLCGSAVWT